MKKEEFSCTRDGLTIRGYVFGKKDTPSPAVILSHGFLANQKMCSAYAKLLAGLGFTAFTFDFCGGGLGSKSDGKSEQMTVLSEKKDLLAMLDAVKKQPYVDPKRVSLLGCSQGGLVSMLAAKERPEEIASLMVLYPALCIPDDARKGKMMFYKFDPENIPEILGRFPMILGGDYAKTVVNMEIFQEIGGYSGPVLYLQGTADQIVPAAYARKAHPLYPEVFYKEIEGGGHMFKGKAEQQTREYIVSFVKENKLH